MDDIEEDVVFNTRQEAEEWLNKKLIDNLNESG